MSNIECFKLVHNCSNYGDLLEEHICVNGQQVINEIYIIFYRRKVRGTVQCAAVQYTSDTSLPNIVTGIITTSTHPLVIEGNMSTFEMDDSNEEDVKLYELSNDDAKAVMAGAINDSLERGLKIQPRIRGRDVVAYNIRECDINISSERTAGKPLLPGHLND